MKVINNITLEFIDSQKRRELVVATPSLEKYNELLKVANDLGFTINSSWEIYKENTCVRFSTIGEMELYSEARPYYESMNIEIFEYQPLSEKEQIEQEIARLQARLEELNKPKWEIYKEKPKFNEKYYFVDLSTLHILEFSVPTAFDNAYWRNVILHKTKESAELELEFRKELNYRKRPFEYGVQNWFLSYYPKNNLVSLEHSRRIVCNKYSFSEDDALFLYHNFPHEVIKAVLFDIKE